MSVFGFVTAGLVTSSGAAGASVGADQQSIAQLEQEIAAQGAQAQSLVTRFNEVQAEVNALDAQIAHQQRVLAADLAAEADAMSTLRRMAIKAYTGGQGMNSAPLEIFGGTTNIAATFEQNQYLGAVSNKMDSALTAVELDQARTQDAQAGVRSKQAEATKTLGELASARDAATAAISADQTKLSHVKGDLRSLLAAASAREHAKQVAAERALAAAAPAPVSPPLDSHQPAPTPTPPTTPTPTPPGSGYANPLRGLVALSAERIDQGVDYSGFGPIYAIGDGVVVNTVGSGWPSGTFIAYQLTDGPAQGLVVYAAEDIQASVQVGDQVTSATVIGQVYAGPDGIETGWADGSRLPDTMARTYGQFDGSNSSAFGYNFSQFLQALGAPGGISSGSPSGTLPASWPRW